MSKVRLKENINKEPEENFPIAHTKTRAQELEQRQLEKQFANYDDIKPMLKKVGGTLIKSEEHLPIGDLQTYNKGEWQKLNEKSFNSKNNTYYSWH